LPGSLVEGVVHQQPLLQAIRQTSAGEDDLDAPDVFDADLHGADECRQFDGAESKDACQFVAVAWSGVVEVQQDQADDFPVRQKHGTARGVDAGKIEHVGRPWFVQDRLDVPRLKRNDTPAQAGVAVHQDGGVENPRLARRGKANRNGLFRQRGLGPAIRRQ